MWKPAILAFALALSGTPAPAADAPDQIWGLNQSRANSCGSTAFDTHTDAKGQVDKYIHTKIPLTGPTKVGDALLEWCQSAQNAVIYFYVDNPNAPDHKDCAQNMSIALFPGEGANVREIIDDNATSYFEPGVRLVEKPRTGPVDIDAGGHKIAAYQLEGVIIDPTGKPRRHRMIGYDKGGDFVRVMTGMVDQPACHNETVKSFLAKLSWP